MIANTFFSADRTRDACIPKHCALAELGDVDPAWLRVSIRLSLQAYVTKSAEADAACTAILHPSCTSVANVRACLFYMWYDIRVCVPSEFIDLMPRVRFVRLYCVMLRTDEPMQEWLLAKVSPHPLAL